MDKTEFLNLQAECVVLIKGYYPHVDVEYHSERESCQIWIELIDRNHFSISINDELRQFVIKTGQLYDVTSSPLVFSKISLSKDLRYFVKVGLNLFLESKHHKKMPWGILQGIRPIKLVHKIYKELQHELQHELEHEVMEAKTTLLASAEPIIQRLCQEYYVNEAMAKFAVEVAVNEAEYRPQSIKEAQKQCSIYISIPFCPTRCHYCSFPSNVIEQFHHTLYDYIDTVIYEWDCIMKPLLKSRSVSCLYIGGGTPTVFSSEELTYLLSELAKRIDFSLFKEITLEAGRPDTITLEKLRVIQSFGIHRISINPQTMNQKTLDTIGRKHTIQHVYTAYQLAEEIGIKRINMDVILGLPDETLEDVEHTLRAIGELNPMEITVHTLAIKRSSKVNEQLDHYHLPTEQETNRMVEWSMNYLKSEKGYKPYYLYRQKNMVASHENVGYFKGDKPCIYNIEIMEEVMPIVALGAGAISKEIDDHGNPIRCENVKNVEIYMERIEEMILRKKEVFKVE
jgi:coproporphyrinogen dehydrogenase HemZ